jgi:hypothetical protein
MERPSGPGNDRPEMIRIMERSARERLTTELGTSGYLLFPHRGGAGPSCEARRGLTPPILPSARDR